MEIVEMNECMGFIGDLNHYNDITKAYLICKENIEIWIVIENAIFENNKKYLDSARKYESIHNCDFDLLIFDEDNSDDICEQINCIKSNCRDVIINIYDDKNDIELLTGRIMNDLEEEFEYDNRRNIIHYKNSKGKEYWSEYNDEGLLLHYRNNYGYEEWDKKRYKENDNIYEYNEWFEYDKSADMIFKRTEIKRRYNYI